MDERRGSEELAAYYEGLLEEQEASGLSVAAFAEEVGLSAATLYSWRRRLRSLGEEAQVLEVDVVEDEDEDDGRLSLHVGDRFRIEVPVEFDPLALSRLIQVLVQC